MHWTASKPEPMMCLACAIFVRAVHMPRIFLFLLANLGLACFSIEAEAQVYPSRPITMVAPFAAGAPVDTVGRFMAERMRVSLGQPVIVENVSGGGGAPRRRPLRRVAAPPGPSTAGDTTPRAGNPATSPHPD